MCTKSIKILNQWNFYKIWHNFTGSVWLNLTQVCLLKIMKWDLLDQEQSAHSSKLRCPSTKIRGLWLIYPSHPIKIYNVVDWMCRESWYLRKVEVLVKILKERKAWKPWHGWHSKEDWLLCVNPNVVTHWESERIK